MNFLRYLIRGLHIVLDIISTFFFTLIAKCRLRFWGVKTGKGLVVSGWLKLNIRPESSVSIGNNVNINSGYNRNFVGGKSKTGIWVEQNAVLDIADYTGISNATIVCTNSITIGAGTMIGGGTCIYDTDFHPVTVKGRINKEKANSSPIVIGKNVFVGGHSIILKGVHIGDGAVVGAGSIVTKNILPNQVWAGNPVKFIKELA
jgi:carbonic anhydrase/acetyltransferase-like protein (isoleucine patch superfamily)